MDNSTQREAINRARFFLDLANKCPVEERDEFEAYLEATIIFGRTVMHRLQKKYERHAKWQTWWNELFNNEAVLFFKNERDFILKEGPPKIGQVIGLGAPVITKATELYYYDKPEIPATHTIERHLNTIESILMEAEVIFSDY